MKAIGKTPVYWIVRIVLSLAIVFILSACAAPAPLPAEEGTPTPTLIPTLAPTATPESTPTPPPTPVPVGEIFKTNQEFYTALSAQDKQASENFSVKDGKTYLSLGSQKVEVDPSSGAVNVDVNGKPLLVEDTGLLAKPITIRGTGKEVGRVFAYNLGTKYSVVDPETKKVSEVVIPAHWFEVIQTNHQVDQKASEAEKMKQREVAINDPIKVSLEQVQNGDWAMSTLLSGYLKPSKDTKFTGNALYHSSNDPTGGNVTALYTSDKIPVDYFGVIIGGVADGIALRPYQVLNPADVVKPDKSQILIVTVGMGKERQTKEQNSAYLDFVNKLNAEPILVVSSSINVETLGSGSLVDQPSVLVLKQVPGNDPLLIGFIIDTINAANSNPNIDKDFWQAPSQSALPGELQNLIWLATFS
ncbi:MAG: hypothetical protein HY022_09365 [Chloroflexi bacterium]|nr:hypothetical protein [Chloroflexota bacterium]